VCDSEWLYILVELFSSIHFFQSILLPGLIITSGKKWLQRRKIITPSFHFKILEQFAEVMDIQGCIFVENLKKLEGQDVDFFPMMSLYALDVICGRKLQKLRVPN